MCQKHKTLVIKNDPFNMELTYIVIYFICSNIGIVNNAYVHMYFIIVKVFSAKSRYFTVQVFISGP